MTLTTERDVIETLAGKGSVTLEQLYQACEEAGVIARNEGEAALTSHPSDRVWRRRVRGALQSLKRSGRAQRVGDATWVIDGTPEQPRRMLLVIAGDPSHLELVLADAEQLLNETDEPVDLILADSPWGLGIDLAGDQNTQTRIYERDASRVVGGYVDVEPTEFAELCERWMSAAVRVLRPGAYLCAVTGPAQAARAQITAESLGLNFVNQVVIRRPFALRTTRQFSHAHTVATILCVGDTTSAGRFFATAPGLPKAESGGDYPLDWWQVPKYERRNLAKYPTMMSPVATRHLVQSLTTGPENGHEPWSSLVVDPFTGGGATAVACWETKRRFRGGDINPRALAFTAARLLDEHVWPNLTAPPLFS
jgi:DNA modification methylase